MVVRSPSPQIIVSVTVAWLKLVTVAWLKLKPVRGLEGEEPEAQKTSVRFCPKLLQTKSAWATAVEQVLQQCPDSLLIDKKSIYLKTNS